MALADDINNLPTTVGDGNTGHLNNHQVIHAGLKSHEDRLTTHRHASEGITDAVSTIPASPNRVVKTNAEGKIFIPTASITAQGDLVNKAYVDAETAKAGHGFFYSGVGSPIGKISAPVGSTYIDTAATLGAIRWVKTSGTGSSGWEVEYGDTGWRNIESLLSDTPSNGDVRIRRRAGTIDLHINWLKFQDALTVTATLGVSWGGDFNTGSALVDINAAPAGTLRLTGGGALTITRPAIATTQDVIISFPSTKPWPTAYIGTPA